MASATADLHFHTLNSDGKHSVSWILGTLKKVHQEGLLQVAILTDHDGVGGYEEFAEGVRPWTKPICASELSCTYIVQSGSAAGSEIELHLLVYGLDPKDPELTLQLDKFRIEREARFFRILDRLKNAGYVLDGDAIAKRHSGVLGRPHVADALVNAGYAKNRTDAFDRFLKDGRPYNVKKWRFPLADAVQYARSHGCRTSIAHPGQYGFKEALLKEFRDLGVDGIEVYHPRHTISDTRFYWDQARALGFLMSGGSDFHSDDNDKKGELPSLGRSDYTFEDAKKFLGDLL